MRFALVLLLSVWSVPALAQYIDVDEVVRNAAVERARARCLLRAAGRAERLAAVYERARSDAARAQIAERVMRAAQARQACMDAADEEGLSSGVGFPPTTQRSFSEQVQVRVHMRPADGAADGTSDGQAVRQVWSHVRRPMLSCIEQVALRDRSLAQPFEASYTVDDDLRASSIAGVPGAYHHCFAWLQLAAHSEALRGKSVRVIVRIQTAPPPPQRDPMAVDFPNRR